MTSKMNRRSFLKRTARGVSDGRVWVNRGAIEAEPKSLLNEPFGPHDIRLPVSTFHQGCHRIKARQTDSFVFHPAHPVILSKHLFVNSL